MKKLIFITFTIFLTLISINGYCDTTVTPPISQISLTLEKAYDLCASNNLDVQLINKKIDIVQKKYDNSIKRSEEVLGKIGYTESTNLQYRKDEKLNWRICKLDLEDYINQKETMLTSLQYDIKKKFMDISLLQQDSEILNKEIENIDRKLSEINLRVQLGLAKESEYQLTKSQKYSLQNQLLSINNQIDNSMLQLKKQLGISLTFKVILTPPMFPYIALNESNLSEIIERKANSDFSILKIKQQIENKEIEKQVVISNTIFKESIDMSTYDIPLIELESKLNQQELDLMVQYWNQYLNLKILNETILVEEANLELEKLNYDAIQAKSKLGMIDTATESNARISYSRQQNNLQRAKYNYILAVEQFNEQLGVQ